MYVLRKSTTSTLEQWPVEEAQRRPCCGERLGHSVDGNEGAVIRESPELEMATEHSLGATVKGSATTQCPSSSYALPLSMIYLTQIPRSGGRGSAPSAESVVTGSGPGPALSGFGAAPSLPAQCG